jgi:thiamine-phosphate pyrophosphorylase
MFNLTLPIIYQITGGTTTTRTTPQSDEFSHILRLVESAVALQISLFQIREKELSGRVLYELASRAADIARGSATKVLVNDRSDVANSAGAHGVQLTARSLPPDVVRRIHGDDFLIGVSTHSVDEARVARERRADFVLFGPIFETASKRMFGEPQGLDRLREVTIALQGFPVVAIGGIGLENVSECLNAGATGVAAIRLFANRASLQKTLDVIRKKSDQ